MSRLHQAIKGDVERKLYAVTIVAVGGKVVFEQATGFADRHADKPMRLDSVSPSSPSRRRSTPCWSCSEWSAARSA